MTKEKEFIGFIRPFRMIIPTPHYELDDTLETEQGQEKSVRSLYEDYVLGRLDIRDIGGKCQYDPDDSNEVDPMNQFGVTLEETTAIMDAGAAAHREVKQKQEQAKQVAVAKAKADAISEARKQIEAEQAQQGKQALQ